MPCCWILPTLSLLAALPGSLAHARGVHRARVVRDAGDIGAAYDYIVVGGGTAGLTVADRLTEDPATTVLVVENGILDDSASILRVQGGSGGLNPRFLYDITSVPQPHLRNRSAPVLAGNVVGGSSAVNGMMCVRGTAEDYDRWGRFFDGDDGDDVASRDNSSSSLSSDWSWHGMLPYFRKALRFVPPRVDVARSANISYDARFWGADGTSGVFAGWPSFQYADTALFYNAYAQIPGAQFPIDSGAGQAGVFWYPTFMDPASVTRSYARTGHYDRQQNRSNYHLVTGSRVDRVLLNGTTAVGVHVVAAARRDANTNTTTPRQVLARREVILAAGAIHTPQVLQLSGIGPAQLLAAANITPVVDLPGVGQNFQDHPSLAISIAFQNFSVHPSSLDLVANASFRAWAAEVWAANRTGPYSIGSPNAASWLPFPVVSARHRQLADRVRTQNASDYLARDAHPTVAAGYAAQLRAYAAALGSRGTAFYNAVVHGALGSGNFVLLHPLSRGTVTLDPRDPWRAAPLVDYRALSNPVDVALLADMLRFTRRFFLDNPAVAALDPRELRPGPDVVDDGDEAALADYVAANLAPSEFHPAGTAAMLPRQLGGVVDRRLRVYGVRGLRVVDASVMPTLPGANTCQTVYAIAEKAADLIREDGKGGKEPGGSATERQKS